MKIKLIFIIVLLVIACGMVGCNTQKNGCGSYDKWEAKTKFRG